jgi:hypothetical protein
MISVTTFYTPEYKQEADEWRRTCHHFLQPSILESDNTNLKQYPFKSYERFNKGSWVHNCTMKADVILEAIRDFKSGVVWTDADARFRSYPKLFEQLDNYDFGCYWIPNVWNQSRNSHLKPWGNDRGNEALAGGTLFFNNTDIAIELIHEWKKESEENPTRWEQQSLQKVWDRFDKKGLKTFNFPQSYCKVFDCKWFEKEEPIVIEHMQASRRLKGTIK